MSRFACVAIMLGLSVGFWLTGQQDGLFAQEEPVPTSVPVAENAATLYDNRCANCHGSRGNGDGAIAAQSINPPTAFANPAYRQTAVPSELFTTIKNGRLSQGMPLFGPGSSDPLSDEQIWELVALIYSLATPPEAIERGRELAEGNEPPTNLAFWATQSNETVLATLRDAGALPEGLSESDEIALIDYLRTGSYVYIDPALLGAPLETATISGTVINGTTKTAVANQSVTLRAFTSDFLEASTQTTTTNPDGSYRFDLVSVPPDWTYIVSTEYGGIPFASGTGQLSRANPSADFLLTVYETTTSSNDIIVEQIQIIVDFLEDAVQIAELYTFSNLGTAAFIGEEGELGRGTVRFELPAGATNVMFQRGFNIETFRPAPEVIETDSGFADVEPVRPGRGTSSMLVTYRLPFRPGMTVAHPLPYSVSSAALLLPNAGTEVAGDGWSLVSEEILQIGRVSNYVNSSIQSADVLRFEINGRPRLVRDADGNTIVNRSSQRELVVGLVTLAAVGVFAYWLLKQTKRDEQTAEQLLHALAYLDSAYENGEVTQQQYVQRRRALKADLSDLWKE